MELQEPGIEIIATVRASDLARSWRQDFGIDASRLFDGVERLAIAREVGSGLIRFIPAILGDPEFYAALRAFKWYHPTEKAEFRTAAEWVNAGQRVIDVGAGNGAFAAHTQKASYLGLETDAAAAHACRARGLNVRPMTAAAHREDANFRPADLVTAFQVLEHVADPASFLDDLWALARPGGHVAIGVPDAESYLAHLPDFVLNAPPHHVTWWSERALRVYLTAAGFRVVDMVRFPVEPWERQLRWMARVAHWLGYRGRPAFGRRLRPLKVSCFLASAALQRFPGKKGASGSTLLAIARKPARV